ncbi:MAG: Panacea domain-containing protein [Planctomycetota bacterium]|jgi:uncharacterized phage-associated protein
MADDDIMNRTEDNPELPPITTQSESMSFPFATNTFPFVSAKVIQAAACVLRASESPVGRMRLLKLLYLADRESLAEIGRPITGDRMVSLDKGPILSRTYDMIKGTDPDAPSWQKVFQNRFYLVIQQADVGVDLLTRYEAGKLQAVVGKYRDMDDEELSALTHTLPEYKNPNGGSIPITLDDILRAVGREGDIDSIKRDAHEQTVVHRALTRSVGV